MEKFGLTDLARITRFAEEGLILGDNSTAVPSKPAVMFVCIHNAGRSQMAQGFLQHYMGDRVISCSSGSSPGDAVNAIAVQAMAEKGISLASAFPKALDTNRFAHLTHGITMGCGDVCPNIAAVEVQDWKLEDPRGADIETVRGIRDQIEERVKLLVQELDSRYGM